MRTIPKKLRITSLASVFGLGVPLLIASACGTDAPGPVVTTGGTANATGGTSTGTGGTSTGTGGTSTGGTSTGTGGISTGGIVGATGGTVGTGGSTQGGSTQGGSTTGGSAQGGSTQGGSTQGGSTTGGSSTGGSSTGGSTQGGSTQGGSTQGGGGAGGKGGGTSTGGSSTGGSTTGGTGGGDLIDIVAKTLDGKMLLGPCLQSTGENEVCLTNKQGTQCPGGNPTNPLAGVLTTDTTITLGGDSSKTYSITLHVQGEVEAKDYSGGTDQKTGEAVSSKMDGFHTGGTPVGGDNYNVYMLRVSAPAQDYFLNDLIGNAVSNHTTYLIDYTAKITAKGGATVRMIAADSNCSMIKNCGPQANGQCQRPLIIESPDPKAKSLNPSFDFSKAYNGQWVVMVVTAVTEM